MQCFPRPRWADFVCGWVRRWPMAGALAAAARVHPLPVRPHSRLAVASQIPSSRWMCTMSVRLIACAFPSLPSRRRRRRVPSARPSLVGWAAELTHRARGACAEKYDFGTKTDESDASKTDPEKQLEVHIQHREPALAPLAPRDTHLFLTRAAGAPRASCLPCTQEYKKAYEAEGMGRKARAVILTHLHGHPHLLLFKPKDRRDRDSRGPTFKLPGGALKTGESPVSRSLSFCQDRLGAHTKEGSLLKQR